MNYLMYNNKPHKIMDIEDVSKKTPGGTNVYHLEGGHSVRQEDLDPKKHHMMFPEEVKAWHKKQGSSSKELDKQDRIETTPDGKMELDVGKEPLDKHPGGMTKSLSQRWSLIKKAFRHEDSFMDLSGAEEPTKEDEQAPPDTATAPQDGSEDQGQEAPSDNSQEAGDDQGADDEDAGNAQAADQDDDGAGDIQAADQGDDQELIDALKQTGHSDAEIAHILHGHAVPTPTPDDVKSGNLKAQGQFDLQSADEDHKLDQDLKRRGADQDHEHKKRMKDLEYEHAKAKAPDTDIEKKHNQRMKDLEYDTQKVKSQLAQLDVDHQKRMKDLEFKTAQKQKEKEAKDPSADIEREKAQFEMEMMRQEKELELEYKKKELELNLKLKAEQAKMKAEMQKEQMTADHEVNTQIKQEQAKHKIVQAKADAKVTGQVKAEQAKHKVTEAKKPPKKEQAVPV